MPEAGGATVLPAGGARTFGLLRGGSRSGLALAFLVAAGGLLRLANLDRPVPMSSVSWRESDVAAIARSYLTEGFALFYPRIDWRGDGPGYTEMEFPLLPAVMAGAGLLGRNYATAGRFFAWLVSVATILALWRLSAGWVRPEARLPALAFFVASPVAFHLSCALQPDGPALLCGIVAIDSFGRWLSDSTRRREYRVALASYACAVLLKATMVHVGLVLGLLAWARWGRRAALDRRLWLLGLGGLVPAVAWSVHAGWLWRTYGNSLGVSNESHWFGLDLLNLSVVRSFGSIERAQVWTVAGAALALIGLVGGWREGRAAGFAAWLGGLGLFYLVTLRMVAGSWAFYYHAASAPVAALLFGEGVVFVARRAGRLGAGFALALAGAALAIGTSLILPALAGAGSRAATVFWAALAAAVLASGLATLRSSCDAPPHGRPRPLVGMALALALAATAAQQAGTIASHSVDTREFAALRGCVTAFSPHIPRNALIVASSPVPSRDPLHRPIAYNASYWFYWLDRKGFNTSSDLQSLPLIEDFRDRGAGFFVAERRDLGLTPGLESSLRERYPVLKECQPAILFDLRASRSESDRR